MIRLGNKAIVTDPCYDISTWCNYIVNDVKPGNYITNIRKLKDSQTGGWGERISEIVLIHEEHQYNNCPLFWKRVSSDIGVDSGQCGIYDLEYRANIPKLGEWDDPDSFYGKACQNTLSDKKWGEQDGAGVTCSSGYGDGTYVLKVAYDDLTKKDKRVIGFEIKFI